MRLNPENGKASKLLQRNLESAKRLRTLLKSWNNPKSLHLHPKVRALVDLIAAIAVDEVNKVRAGTGTWFSKVLVFNKMIEGTAPQLKKEVEKAVAPIFAHFLSELLDREMLHLTDPPNSPRVRYKISAAGKAWLAKQRERKRKS